MYFSLFLSYRSRCDYDERSTEKGRAQSAGNAERDWEVDEAFRVAAEDAEVKMKAELHAQLGKRS